MHHDDAYENVTGGDHKARRSAATATASQSILVVVNQDMIVMAT